MTPEQRALAPQHPHPREGQWKAMAASLNDLSAAIEAVRALRVLRASMEYPPHHSERHKLPGFVGSWEREHGTAPASANQVLDAYFTPSH